jgi:hypothetical protein
MAFWSRSPKPSISEPATSFEQDGNFMAEGSAQSSVDVGMQDMQAGRDANLGLEEPQLEPNHLPMPVSSEEGVMAVHEACNAVEASCLAAAQEESFFAAGWFIDAIITLHNQAGLPW